MSISTRHTVTAALVVACSVVFATAGPQPATAQSQSIRTVRDIQFAQPAGVPLYLDAYIPSAIGPFPVVLTIHGGGWGGGTHDWVANISRRLAAEGFVALAIEYRVGPIFLYPAPVDDVRAAIAWVHANTQRFGMDGSRISALGTSAGATLAMLAALTGSDLQAVVSWSGATDMVALSSSHDPEVLAGVMNFVGTLTNVPDLVAASPITYVGSTNVLPIYLVQSTRELVPVEQGRRMYQALIDAGITTKLQLVEGDHHGTKLAPWAMSPSVDFLKAYGT
jgi:acetyl esterase/lipase